MMHSKLNKKIISEKFDESFTFEVPEIHISQITESTNEDAKQELSLLKKDFSIHLSEQQIAGKGRNGKPWVSPKEKNIYLSIAWNSKVNLSALEGLSLAIGTGVANCLNSFSKFPIEIKWPNDLMAKKRKLSGILIETQDLGGNVGVVIGVGVNVHMTIEDGEEIDQEWISLDELSSKKNDRNEIVANLLGNIFEVLDSFTKKGFIAFKEKFEDMNYLAGKECTVNHEGNQKFGTVIGVNDIGELEIKQGSKYLTLRYGEVSIREL